MKQIGHAVLVRHSASRGTAVRGLEIDVSSASRGELALSYVLEGNLDGLRIPLAEIARRSDRLWEHTCFEVFLMVNDGPEYVEFNFAPSCEWAMYQFSRLRERAAKQEGPPTPPSIEIIRGRDRFELRAQIDVAALLRPAAGARVRLGLSAIVEEVSGDYSFWALRHPAAKPDFHNSESFVLELEGSLV